MKKVAFIIALVGVLGGTFAQNTSDQPKSYISVVGFATMEIIPNEIDIRFIAKEYKKGNEDVTLETIHTQLLAVLKELSIPEENLEVESFYGNRWVSKRKIKDLYANKNYVLKLTNISMIDKLLEGLDEINIEEVALDKITHSDIEKYKEQVKINATLNAKTKAGLMATTLDQKLGKAFEVIETHNSQNVPSQNRYTNYEYDKEEYKSSFSELDDYTVINFKKITISYSIYAKFELL